MSPKRPSARQPREDEGSRQRQHRRCVLTDAWDGRRRVRECFHHEALTRDGLRSRRPSRNLGPSNKRG